MVKVLGKNRPTCGAIILNQRKDKVLMTERGGKWGFPKGGMNENETEERCAVREVKEEVGLFIHNKVNSEEKIEFMNRGVKISFFIVKDVHESERLKIDTNEIDDAFWVYVSDVSRNVFKLTEKSRLAWKEYEKKSIVVPKLSMEQFLNTYRDKGRKV